MKLRIRDIRRAKPTPDGHRGPGWSQQHLADMAQCSQGLIANLERGDAGITVEKLQTIADALDVFIGDLFVREGDPAQLGYFLTAFRRMSDEDRRYLLRLVEAMASGTDRVA